MAKTISIPRTKRIPKKGPATLLGLFHCIERVDNEITLHNLVYVLQGINQARTNYEFKEMGGSRFVPYSPELESTLLNLNKRKQVVRGRDSSLVLRMVDPILSREMECYRFVRQLAEYENDYIAHLAQIFEASLNLPKNSRPNTITELRKRMKKLKEFSMLNQRTIKKDLGVLEKLVKKYQPREGRQIDYDSLHLPMRL